MKTPHPVRRPGYSRRRFLCGAGGATLALPALSLFQEQAFAQRAQVPKRLMIVFTPNGTLREEWVTGGGTRNFRLGPILEPLEDVRNRLLVLRGLDSDVAYTGPGDGHQTGMGCMLTGRSLLEGSTQGGNSNKRPAGLASGISIDQHIASKIGRSSAFRSLSLGVQTPRHVDVWTRMSYSGSNRAISPENDPGRAYMRIANLAAEREMDGVEAERRSIKRGLAYSAVRDELRRFRNFVAPDDRAKLDQHLDHVAELEARVSQTQGPTCDIPAALRRQVQSTTNDIPKIGEAQMQLAVHALACDLTRVVTLQWSGSVGTIKYPWLGLELNHHTYSHEVDSKDESRRAIRAIDRWHAEQFGTLVRSLMSREAEDGTSLLEHTLVLWVNELGRGSNHSRRDQSWLMAGNLGGYFDTGRSVELQGRSNNDLFVTMMRGFGLEDATFGDPAFNGGPLDQLTA